MDADKIAFESGGAGLVSTIESYKHFTQMLLHGAAIRAEPICHRLR